MTDTAKPENNSLLTDDADNCNNRIAPWFRKIDIELQRFGKVNDFKRTVNSMEYEINNTLCSPETSFNAHSRKMVESTKHYTSPNTQHLSNNDSQSFESIKSDRYSSASTSTLHIDLNNTVSGISYGPNDTGYRNKNKFTFGYGIECFDFPPGSDIPNDHVKLGFIGGEYPKVFIADCDAACTIDDKFKTLCKGIEKIVKNTTIKPFLQPPRKHKKLKKHNIVHIPNHRGVWRYLTVRRAKKSRHMILDDEYVYMVTLTSFVRNVNDTNRDEYNRIIGNMKEYLQSVNYVSSFNLVEYSANLEPAASDKAIMMFSRGTCGDNEEPGVIYETLMGKIFRISPMSFFQVNTEVTELLYNEIGYMFDHLFVLNDDKDAGHKKLLIDLYCGTGTIGICLANRFDHIIGVDIVESCINDAKINAKINNIENCTFLIGRCEDKNILDTLQSTLDQISNGQKIKIYLVVDPARDGLHKKVRRFIKGLNLDGFVYCSCNVKTWNTDVVDMIKKGPETVDDGKKNPKNKPVISLYPIKTMIFDMFPHTQHYEVLSSFKCLPQNT